MTPWREVLGFLSRTDRRAIALTAALGGALAWPLAGADRAPGFALLAGLCLAIVLIDGRRFLVPDLLVLPIAALGLVDAAAQGADLVERVVAMGVLAAALLALRLALGRALGRVALGLGDVKLLAAAAAWLPGALVPALVGASAVTGLIESLALAPHAGRIAFGRHLAPWLWGLALLAPWLTPVLAPIPAPS